MKDRLNQDLDISVGDNCLLLFHKVKHVRQPDLNKPKIKKQLWNKEKQFINNPNLTQLKVTMIIRWHHKLFRIVSDKKL